MNLVLIFRKNEMVSCNFSAIFFKKERNITLIILKYQLKHFKQFISSKNTSKTF